MSVKALWHSSLKWLWIFLVGAFLGFGLSFLPRIFAIPAAGILASGFFLWSRKRSRDHQIKLLQDISRSFPGDSPMALEISGSCSAPEPMESALKMVVNHVAQSGTAENNEKTNSGASIDEALIDIEKLAEEQEKAVQTFRTFREVIREWVANIEKAGRINKSLLQLNEMIVNDSK